MADNDLTVDLTGPITWCFDFKHVDNKTLSLDEWDFSACFGTLSDAIKSVFAVALDEYFRKEPPFTLYVPQLDPYIEEPVSPLDIRINFGFSDDRDEHHYIHSIDKIVAIEFDTHRTHQSSGYLMSTERLRRFKRFSAALRELADKMDVELTNVRIKEDEDDD